MPLPKQGRAQGVIDPIVEFIAALTDVAAAVRAARTTA